MEKFIIRELQNVNSTRKGYFFTGSIEDAKKEALKNKVYYRTVLKIQCADDYSIAATYENGKWIDWY